MLTLCFAFLLAHAIPALHALPQGDDRAGSKLLLVEFHELTGDAIPDRLAVDRAGCIHVSVSMQNNQYLEISQDLPLVQPMGLLVEDLNGDQVPDLFFATEAQTLALEGLGGGMFQTAPNNFGLTDPGPSSSVEAIDLDDDGRRDILLHNRDEDIVFWREADGSFTRERLVGPGADRGLLVGGGGALTAPSTGAVALQFIPTGAILPYAGVAAPPGYLLCDGSEVDRAFYQRLFTIIGTLYGDGDDLTTFNVPDLRQRFPLGLGTTGTGALLAEAGGAIDHVHSGPAHAHNVPGHGHSFGLTTSTAGDHGHSISGTATSAGAHTHSVSGSTDVAPNHVHNVRNLFNNNCGVFANENESDRLATVKNCNGAYTFHFDEDPAGAHSHGITGTAASSGNHTHSLSGSTNTSGAHNHLVSGSIGNGANNGDAELATDSGTGGITGTNNPPYLTLNFIVKI